MVFKGRGGGVLWSEQADWDVLDSSFHAFVHALSLFDLRWCLSFLNCYIIIRKLPVKTPRQTDLQFVSAFSTRPHLPSTTSFVHPPPPDFFNASSHLTSPVPVFTCVLSLSPLSFIVVTVICLKSARGLLKFKYKCTKFEKWISWTRIKNRGTFYHVCLQITLKCSANNLWVMWCKTFLELVHKKQARISYWLWATKLLIHSCFFALCINVLLLLLFSWAVLCKSFLLCAIKKVISMQI